MFIVIVFVSSTNRDFDKGFMDVLTGRGRFYMLESYGFGLCVVRRGGVI